MAFEPKEEQKELNYQELRIYSDEELNSYTDEELKNFKIKHDIPMLEDLESGPWPSFVADAKRQQGDINPHTVTSIVHQPGRTLAEQSYTSLCTVSGR